MRTPHTPHPNLSDQINANIAESEILGGVWVTQPTGEAVKDEPVLPVGRTLRITTRSRTYTLTKTGESRFTIEGHPEYCPTPTPCRVHGSTWGGSMLKLGWVGRGMHLQFSLPGQPGQITTSTVLDVVEQEVPA